MLLGCRQFLEGRQASMACMKRSARNVRIVENLNFGRHEHDRPIFHYSMDARHSNDEMAGDIERGDYRLLRGHQEPRHAFRLLYGIALIDLLAAGIY